MLTKALVFDMSLKPETRLQVAQDKTSIAQSNLQNGRDYSRPHEIEARDTVLLVLMVRMKRKFFSLEKSLPSCLSRR